MWWLALKTCRCFIAWGEMKKKVCSSPVILNAKYESYCYDESPSSLSRKWLTFWGSGGGVGFPGGWRSCCSVIVLVWAQTDFGSSYVWCVIVAVAKKCNQGWQSQAPHDSLELWQHRNYILKPTACVWQTSDIGYSFSPLLRVRDEG